MRANSVCRFRTRGVAIQDQDSTAKWDPRGSHDLFLMPVVDFDQDTLFRAGSMELALRRAPAGIVVCDAAGNVTFINAAARKLVARDPAGEAITHTPEIWGEMVDCDGCRIPASRFPCIKALRGEITNGQECRLIRQGSGPYDVLFSAVPITPNRDITGAIVTLADITEHKQEELQLREDAVSKERERMAADLHDTVCQNLTAIGLLLDAAEREFPTDSEKARRYFSRAHEVARTSLAEARRTMWTLSNESLEKEDLATALSFIARQLFDGTPVRLEFSLQPETRELSPELRRELLRIGREALANALKHSNATKVCLDLIYQNREVQLCVLDDGHGFVVDPGPSSSRGRGLNNMRRRAERMGGKLVIHSLPGQGTRLVAALPLSSGVSYEPSARPAPQSRVA
jgi:signal transduction histidine kinase